MHTPVPEYLQEVLDALAGDDGGEVAQYIPDLAAADPDGFGLALATVAGRTHAAGDADREFSIQSVSKPFAYAAALMDRGFDTVLGSVGVEPSGEAFDELSLENGSHRPKNPMINAGAITVHQLLAGPGAGVDRRVERVLAFFSELADRPLTIDDSVLASELGTADRNLALAHMLRNHGVIDTDAHEAVRGYTAQCSVLVTARDLAVMGSVLAGAGVHPHTGERVMPAEVARQTLSAMAAAGMYDSAGTWFSDVGIPAKSGVSGGMLGVLPGQVGIGVFSPRLDAHGNSVRGVKVCERLSRDMNLHLMVSEPYGPTVLREVRSESGRTTVALQGTVQFTGAEEVLNRLERTPDDGSLVVFDLSRVDRFVDVGRRMTLEGMRRLRLDGHPVALVDPDGVLPDPDLGDGHYPELLG
ncbi:glutaminase [Nocardiopsis sp. HNM0947]|uniref:Glutaminase n=1 Tax=Nocardiopsis coralli TaxID=2772213 RepID=A0ABR9PEQ1_9ACTN|nr:glutaminase [Nocardiopsis coralli]MBE3002320.1 glutaminase [Nocardiopsis coralli]